MLSAQPTHAGCTAPPHVLDSAILFIDNFEMSGYCGNFVTQTDDTSLAAESWSEPAKTAKVREALFCLEKPRKTHEKSGIWSFAKPQNLLLQRN